MKTLELKQMENLIGGREVDPFDCGLAIAGLVVGFAGLAMLTAASGGLATGVAVVGFQIASVSAARAC